MRRIRYLPPSKLASIEGWRDILPVGDANNRLREFRHLQRTFRIDILKDIIHQLAPQDACAPARIRIMRPQSEIQAVLFGMVHMPVQNEGVDAVQEVRNVIGIRIGRRLHRWPSGELSPL